MPPRPLRATAYRRSRPLRNDPQRPFFHIRARRISRGAPHARRRSRSFIPDPACRGSVRAAAAEETRALGRAGVRRVDGCGPPATRAAASSSSFRMPDFDAFGRRTPFVPRLESGLQAGGPQLRPPPRRPRPFASVHARSPRDLHPGTSGFRISTPSAARGPQPPPRTEARPSHSSAGRRPRMLLPDFEPSHPEFRPAALFRLNFSVFYNIFVLRFV